MAVNLVIDTITTTETTLSFQVVNFGSSRTVNVKVDNNGTVVFNSNYYIGQFTYQTISVSGLSPGTTYTITATASPDVTTATATTEGTPSTTKTTTITGRTRIRRTESSTISGQVNIYAGIKGGVMNSGAYGGFGWGGGLWGGAFSAGMRNETEIAGQVPKP